MQNDGKEAEKAFIAYWEKVGHIERLRDTRDLRGINGNRSVNSFSLPSDFIVSSPNHVLHYAEVKSTYAKKSFPFSNIEPHQHRAATLEATRGSGNYLFYIFSYHTGQWYLMPCADYAVMVKHGCKSVAFEELMPWVK